jgi:photosystem II stability/assembly factor-like uncharacterized protein
MKKKSFLMICLLSALSFAQWNPSNNGMGFESVGALFADGDSLYAGTTFDVFKSTNEGNDWSDINNGLPPVCNFYAITKINGYIVAGGDNSGIWRSSDFGANWVQITSGVDSDEYVYSFYVNGNTLYGTFGLPPSIGISTDNGTTWTKSTNGLSSNGYMTGITKLGSTLFATHSALGLHVSTDNGVSWTLPLAGIGAQDKNVIITSGSNLCVGTTNGIWLSVDGGANWTHPLTSEFISGLTTKGNEVFAVGQLPYKSTDNGVTWNPINADGLPGSIWNTMQFTTNYAFVNYLGVGVYRRTISEVSSINEQISFTADEFKLAQNYPNPFNPSTTIEYSIPRSGIVQIVIYNLLGEIEEILVNKFLTAGSYRIHYDASLLPAGVYFYKITSGNFSETKKMILLQ